MDLQSLGALLATLGGYFSAQAGAKAGQLQGLLTGEDITERRKRMKMAEEAHQLQTELARSEEKRRSEFFPLQMRGVQQQIEQEAELFPHKRDILATQKDKAILDLTNARLWSLYQQGVAPSQISDPVLRAQYEPFFNYQMAVRSLEAVQTNEDLQAVLEKMPEDLRPTLELWGRSQLFTNQTRRQMIEKQMQGLDINLAQGEFQLRTMKLNTAITAIINNINNEGMDWDKRSPEQKIEAVKKWIKQLNLEDVVPEDFANMFQRVKSADARQFALFRAQAEMQHRMQIDLMGRQFGYTRALQQDAAYTNLVFGALGGGQGQGGFGGVAPVGFPALTVPNIFNNTYDNRGSNINASGLSNYLKAPLEISVPVSVGNQIVPTPLSVLGSRANAIYQRLGRADATLSADDINTLITFDAGLIQATFAKEGMQMDWNTALLMAKERIVPMLRANPAYRAQPLNYGRVLDNWERAFDGRLQQPQQGQTQQGQPRGGQRTAPQTQTPPMTQADIPRGRIGREP